MHADTTQCRQPCNASTDRLRSSMKKACKRSIVDHDTTNTTNTTNTRTTRVILERCYTYMKSSQKMTSLRQPLLDMDDHRQATTRSAPGSPSRRERDTDTTTIDPFSLISASSPQHHCRHDDLYSLIDPSLLHSPSEILVKSKHGPSYYAYSPSQMANRERCYEIITTTTHDDIFNDRESQDRQSEVENEAFWLGLSEDEIMKRKQSSILPSNCSSTTSTSPRLSTSPSSLSALPTIQDKPIDTSDNDSNDEDDDEEEDDLIDGVGSSSIGLIDLDDLSDDEQVNSNELDDLGPLAKYARENRRKRKMEEMLSSQ
ncbi:hypothetical protein K492DRAFT_221229 [Lichtheimia hyalospora FSU 10163]|nr:hypothetical protein K492DRAFT_221229 [Lichtheimia hyalospora FSU 10163]